MAQRQPRDWSRDLGEQQRKRYLQAGRKQGLTDAQIQQHYESGGSLSAWRGKRQHAGASERQWSAMMQAARRAKLHEDAPGYFDRKTHKPNKGARALGRMFTETVLENLLAKGFVPSWIIDRLEQKAESRDTYRSAYARALRAAKRDAGWQPGRHRYRVRTLIADIELYFYH